MIMVGIYYTQLTLHHYTIHTHTHTHTLSHTLIHSHTLSHTHTPTHTHSLLYHHTGSTHFVSPFKPSTFQYYNQHTNTTNTLLQTSTHTQNEPHNPKPEAAYIPPKERSKLRSFLHHLHPPPPLLRSLLNFIQPS